MRCAAGSRGFSSSRRRIGHVSHSRAQRDSDRDARGCRRAPRSRAGGADRGPVAHAAESAHSRRRGHDRRADHPRSRTPRQRRRRRSWSTCRRPTIPSRRRENIPLNIVYEDDDLIVIDKPSGLVVHPAARPSRGTLVNALIAHCGDTLSGIGGVKRPGIVHRLDKDTTGLLVVAKNDRAHKGLSDQFADHGREGPLVREYLAFVWGAPGRPKGTIDAPIDRHPHARDKMAVRQNGREAITHWQLLETLSRNRRQAGRELPGLPARNRPHPPDPGPPRPCRPPAARRRDLRHRLPDQGRASAGPRPRPRWRALEDRPCMLISWASNTRSQARSCSSVRNCRLTSPVCVMPCCEAHDQPRNREIQAGKAEKVTFFQWLRLRRPVTPR